MPSRPTLEHLKNQARTLQRQVLVGDNGALDAVRAFHPHPSDALLRPACLLYGGDDVLPHAEAGALLERQPDG